MAENMNLPADNTANGQGRPGKDRLVEVKHLKKYFNVRSGVLKAVDDVSFDICRGETLGLVGESGCGKTTCGRTLLGIYEATGGDVFFEGNNTSTMNKQLKKDFKRNAQIIFQDPYASLNPRMTVSDIIAEGMDIHGLYMHKERQERIYEMLNLVSLNKEHAGRFPHEFSGGQRQRIGIARALAINPKFIVCDEPISALDVSIQAQIVNLLIKLQGELNLTYLFIAHDLSMVKHISDRVGVMYLGCLIELATSAELYKNPLHPYTQALLSAIPIPDPEAEKNKQRVVLEGDIPSPINPEPGCRFRSRCRYAKAVCSEKRPELKEVGPGHFVSCHLY
jgi:oligopeptide transport system ATP-binding protein